MDIISYFDSKSIDYTKQGNELMIHCPYCGQKKLSVNVHSHVFQCWKCKAENPESPYIKGHISTLQKEWGDIIDISSAAQTILPSAKKVDNSNHNKMVDRYHANIWNNKKALKFFMKRGITEETIKKYKLGFVRMKDQDWVVYPSYEGDICKLLKYRKLDPDETPDLQKCEREYGSKSIMFNHDALDEYNDIIVCEGESDALTLLQAGFLNVVGATVGASTLNNEWYEKLILMNRVYICFDADSAGQKASKDVWSTRLGIFKCWNVNLPKGYDVNEYFLEYKASDFNELLSEATQWKISGIMSLEDSLYELYNTKDDDEVFELPWPSLNKIIGGGFKRKQLTVLSGQPASGKTTMGLQICHHYAIKYKMPSLFFCLEMPESALAKKILQLHYDLMVEEISIGDIPIFAMEMKGIPIFFGYSSKIQPDTFLHTMEEVRNRYGVQFGVFDNLHRMVRSGEESDMGKASGMFKDLTMDLNIPFLLIAQPRKLNDEKRPTYDSLKGSSAIAADSDAAILIHRPRDDSDDENSFSPTASIIVDKSRYSSGGSIELRLIGEKSRFDEFM